MGAPDIYQDAALAEITLVCGQCGTTLDSEDLPVDQPRYPGAGYFRALADESHRRGWLIEYTGPSGAYFDYRILCPNCAPRKSI